MKSKALIVVIGMAGTIAGWTCAAGGTDPSPKPTPQISLTRVELMPNVPRGFKLLDFKTIARGYDRVAFDPASRFSNVPLMWWDETNVNQQARGIGLPSYVGHPEQKGPGNDHEAITVLGSILGATIAGIDKSADETDFAAMSDQYFNSANGTNLVLNRVSTTTGQSYWYELFPQILFDSIARRYPREARLTEISNIAARRWLSAYEVLSLHGRPDFEHTAFDFQAMKPVTRGKQKEPDAAAGMAHIFLTAYERTRESRYLAAADACIDALEARSASPSYEILLPLGAYAAARLNAEHDREHEIGRLLDWYFEPRSEVRAGWGLIVGNWNDVAVSGLIGSVNDAGGYGFVMNTYASAIGLVPVARYDERYARSIGKWILNAAGAVRYCYPGQLPPENTTRPDFVSDPPNVIAFEGIRHRYKGVSPLAGGDPTVYGWGPSDLGLYGSGFAGVFGGIIRPTDDPLILELDLLAADPCPPKAFPTHLYFNPHDEAKTIHLNVGPATVDLYDALENRVIRSGAAGTIALEIPPNAAREIVRVPAGEAITTEGRRSRVGDVVIDYENGLLPARPVPSTMPAPSKARAIEIAHFTPTIDGDPDEWSRCPSTPVALDTGGRGSLRADVRFAWDEQFLYVLVKQRGRAEQVHEADDRDAFAATPWDFDAVNLFLDLGNDRQPTLGDFVLQLGFSSKMKRDVSFSAQEASDGEARIASATSGSAADGNRSIEARVAWSGMAAAAFGENAPPKITAGLTIGCEPCLIEMNHTRQSFIGGSQYQRPTGRDENSLDLVLQP